MTQKEIVLKALMRGEISTVWAVNNRILRLSERIRNLIADGYKIETFYKYRGKKKLRYAFYRLVKE